MKEAVNTGELMRDCTILHRIDAALCCNETEKGGVGGTITINKRAAEIASFTGAPIFQNSTSHFKILGARKIERSSSRAGEP
jgi:hypothetical protein